MKTILVVTDDPAVNGAIDAELGPCFPIARARTFDEALKLVSRASVVVIDVDTGRFHQDGIALMNEIHKHAPMCGRILLAGSPWLFRALVAGRLSDRVLGRKWKPGSLIENVRQVIRRCNAHRPTRAQGYALASA